MSMKKSIFSSVITIVLITLLAASKLTDSKLTANNQIQNPTDRVSGEVVALDPELVIGVRRA